MNDLLQRFVDDTNARFEGRLSSPRELLDQHFATDPALDAAVIGGYGLRDILAGKVRESEIPPVVLKAFHEQYPHAGSFVDFVRDHKADAALLGIINGIKGKAFELEYVDYLNHGHLPPVRPPNWLILRHKKDGTSPSETRMGILSTTFN